MFISRSRPYISLSLIFIEFVFLCVASLLVFYGFNYIAHSSTVVTVLPQRTVHTHCSLLFYSIINWLASFPSLIYCYCVVLLWPHFCSFQFGSASSVCVCVIKCTRLAKNLRAEIACISNANSWSFTLVAHTQAAECARHGSFDKMHCIGH